jgi:hypothetical protein
MSAAEKIANHVITLTTPAEVHRYVNAHLSDLGTQLLSSTYLDQMVS